MNEKDVRQEDLDAAGDDSPDLDYDQITYGTSINRINQGQELDLSAVDPTLVKMTVGLGWDIKSFEETPLDLDASVFLLDKADKTRENEDFIFYNNAKDRLGAVKHAGDSRTGAGEGDDETIHVELTKLSFEVVKIVFTVSIYDEEMIGHNFSDVKNVYFRLVNSLSAHELFRFELHEDMLQSGTALVVAEMERIGAKWMFRALGKPVDGGLGEIAENYGIVVAEHIQA